MSSRLTVDTTTLKVRDVFCLNSSNADYIQPASIPVIGDFGKLRWLSSIEFLSTISVPTLSTTILKVLEAVQPGFSTLSTIFFSTTTSAICSTVAGLGSLPNGNDYISSATLYKVIDSLTYNYGYISATTLYDTVGNLADMRQITDRLDPMVKFLSANGSNLSGGYVSTMNPGNYRIYKSTLGLQGNNVSQSLADGAMVASGTIDIGGFRNKIVGASYLRLDVNANITLNYTGAGPANTSFSTFLVNPVNSQVVGTPASLTFSGSNAMMANLSFLLNSNQLLPFGVAYPNTLNIYHRIINGVGSNGALVTQIPQSGGIFATLDNTD